MLFDDEEEILEDPDLIQNSESHLCKVCYEKTSKQKNFCYDHLERSDYVSELINLLNTRETEQKEAEKLWENFKITQYFPQLNDGIVVQDILKHLLLIERGTETFLGLKEEVDVSSRALHGFLEHLRRQKTIEIELTPEKKEKTYKLTRLGRETASKLIVKKAS